MFTSRLFAASRRALVLAGALSITALASAGHAATQRLGPPYEAGGVWFVPAADTAYDEEGLAAIYGEALEGDRTFSGERFDPRALTAAHATLPVPGVVEVTNLTTGKSVTLRINDRGPYAPGRIISLTPASAQSLGIGAGGEARVRVRYVGLGTTTASIASASSLRPRADVQVGAYGARARADQVAADVSAAGPATVTALDRGGARLYRVSVGPLAGTAEAEIARSRVVALGYQEARIVHLP